MVIHKKSVQKKEKLGEKSFFVKVKNYFREQEKKIVSNPKKQFAFFVLGFVFFYILLSSIILFIPREGYETFTGITTQGLLNIQGVESQGVGLVECMETNWLGMETKSNCYSFEVGEKKIIISWLCTGILEIIILISAILSSFGINWRKKILGVGIAILTGIIFNLIRIWVTINIVFTQNVEVIELAHDFLFKIILFIYITGFYVIWFYWVMKKNNFFEERGVR
jgi:exosortase/archaeosortase family protein